MIDYNKLKIAHELAGKYCANSGMEIVLEMRFCAKPTELICCLQREVGDGPFKNSGSMTIDELIGELKELTQPEPQSLSQSLMEFRDDVYNRLERIESMLEECKHESDGQLYCTTTWVRTKCIHCGEYFK